VVNITFNGLIGFYIFNYKLCATSYYRWAKNAGWRSYSLQKIHHEVALA